MICRMCLLEPKEYINIFDGKGIELTIASIITKYFWFEPKIGDPISSSICNQCWHHIADFHKYYRKVEEAQQMLSEKCFVKEEDNGEEIDSQDNLNENQQVIKGVFQSIASSSTIVLLTQFVTQTKAKTKIVPIEPTLDEDIKEESANAVKRSARLSANLINKRKAEKTETDITEEPRKRGRLTKVQVPTAKKLIGRKRGRPRKVLTFLTQTEQDSALRSTCLLANLINERNAEETETDIIEEPKKRGRPTKVQVQQKLIVRKRGRPRKVQESTLRKSQRAKQIVKYQNRKEKSNKISGPSDYAKRSKESDEYIATYMKLKCELCPGECTTFAQMRAHYRLSHNRKGYIVCCNKKFYRRILLMEHINKHLNPDYFRCKLCDKTFADRNCLKSHMVVMHDPEERKIHRCDKCPRSYSKQHMLERHKLIHVPQEDRTFFCKQCGKAFPSKGLLHSHIRSVHENAYGIMCHICAKVLQGKTMLAKHQLEHAGIVEPKVQCNECGSWLKHKYSLKKHMERHAEQEEEKLNPQGQTCNICGKISPSKAGLRSHIRYAHQAKRNHQCSICEKSFKKALSLKEHMTTHTGEVLYTCPHCPKTFNSSANMHSHRKKKHREEWEENRKNREMAREFFKNNAVNNDIEDPDQLPVEAVYDQEYSEFQENDLNKIESKESSFCENNVHINDSLNEDIPV